jgi:alkanesulfonate monooxygenase SsuD/methylene tetrahydromethanopterin reductase-like flavin-dependent oxidoreductase (luciferase family)
MTDRLDQLRSAFGRVGVWSFALQTQAADQEREAVTAYRAAGYRATWFPESIGSKEAFSHAALLLAATRDGVVATGIANIYARDPMAMMNGARTLADAYPGRFVLGIGVSHAPAVTSRGSVYEKPLTRMTRYLVPVEHTALARRIMGPDALLLTEVTAVLDTDVERARQTAGAFAERYLQSANYVASLKRLGYTDEDVAGRGSVRLLDEVVPQGDVDRIVAVVRAHLDAGADHVCVQLRAPDPADVAVEAYRELAAGLGELLG